MLKTKPMPDRILIKNAMIVTMNSNLDVLKGDILIQDGKIEQIGKINPAENYNEFDATDFIVIPGQAYSGISAGQFSTWFGGTD
ncbi:MAG: hypothetical protein P8Y99_09875 [Calditrichaceae bacterium]